MPLRVLVATDGSKHALEGVEWLLQFPLPSDATIEVVSAVQLPFPGETTAWIPWPELKAQGEQAVADARARLAQRWPTVAGEVLEGEPRQAIIGAALRTRTNLIVLGARGHGAVASLLLGSVSLAVARHAPCPVLVLRGAPRPLRAVTIAIDGSSHAHAALTFFAQLPLPLELAARLIAVVERPSYPSVPEVLTPSLLQMLERAEVARRRELDEALAGAADALRPRVRSVSTATVAGAPGHVIVREAEDKVSDLIVVGARGLGTFERIMLGSVSETVLRHAPCPVLIVRSGSAPVA